MDLFTLRQLSSFAGALMILIAYAAHQMGRMNSRGVAYNLLNGAGSAILAYIAFHPFQVGFVVLEVSWAGISFAALFRRPVELEVQ
jgi:hypothetical protein